MVRWLSIFLALALTLPSQGSAGTGDMPRVGYIGDSLVQGNNWAWLDGDLIFSSTRGEITWARAFYPHFDIDTWIDPSDGGRHFDGMNAGVSGETVAQIAKRLNRTLRWAPDIMIVSAGINSVTTGVDARTISSGLKSICEFYLDHGIRVILANIRPVTEDVIPVASDQFQVLEEVNTWIRSFAMATPGVEFWNVAAAYDDGHGRMKPEYTFDGTHLSSLGAQQGGLSLVAVLQRLVPQQFKTEARNLFPNGRLRGVDGRAGAGITGQVAHGFYARMKPRNAKITAAASIGDDSDGQGVNRFQFSAPGGGKDVEAFILSLNATNLDVSSLAGQWVKARCRLSLSAWTGWRGIQFSVTYADWGAQPPITDEMAAIEWNLEIETMPFKLTETPRPIAPSLTIFMRGDMPISAPGILAIRSFEVFKVEDPTRRITLER